MNDYIGSTTAFRNQIIAVLFYTDWMSKYGNIILPEYFPTDAEQDLLRWINEYYLDYGDAPWDELALNEFQDDEDVLGVIEYVQACSDDDLRYAADKALGFAQAQAMKLAILESVECIRDGDLSRPLELVKDAQRVGTDLTDLGYDLVDDAEIWAYDELRGKRFPTGIPELDSVLDGGLVPGEYGLVLAPPGFGKSTLLVNIGYGMAGLLGAANVLTLTYEMPAQKYLKRYALRAAGVKASRGDNVSAYIQTVRKRARQRLRGHLRVIRPDDLTVDGIRRILDSLDAEGFHVEALIVDYPDLMKPSRRRKELRFELADLARELRELGKDYGMPVWGASQAGRQAAYKEVITAFDIAEAIEKAAIPDVIVSICQTRDEEKLGRGRLYTAKIRDGESHFSIPVKIDFAQQSITSRKALDL